MSNKTSKGDKQLQWTIKQNTLQRTHEEIYIIIKGCKNRKMKI